MNKAFFFSVGILLALGSGCTAPARTPSAQTPNESPAAVLQPPVFGMTTATTTQEHLTAVVETPFIKDGLTPEMRETFNQRLATDTQKLVDHFRESFIQVMTEDRGFEGPDWEPIESPIIPTSTDRIQSVILDTYQYTGGAHGLGFSVTELFDLKTGTFLTLNDLFIDGFNPLPEIASSSNKDLMQREYVKDDPDWVNEGTQPTVENFGTVYATPDGLNIIFGDYQIGPHALGPQTVTIPWSDLEGLKPEYAS